MVATHVEGPCYIVYTPSNSDSSSLGSEVPLMVATHVEGPCYIVYTPSNSDSSSLGSEVPLMVGAHVEGPFNGGRTCGGALLYHVHSLQQ